MKFVLFIVIYLIGIIVWMKLDKKYLPYKKGEREFGYDGYFREITKEIHDSGAISRSITWPLWVVIAIITSLVVIIKEIYNKL